MTEQTTKKVTLRERKKAQPKAIIYFSEAEKATIRQTVGKNLNDSQFKIFMYTSQALGLNPLLNEIACVTYKDREGNSTMSIQVMRDGFLTIAHRSGKFAGLESGVNILDNKIISGWAKVYHKDYQVPVYQEADFEEYNTGRNLWLSKPKTMIKKVAESMALRKAFNISGVYAPEEMDREIATKPTPSMEIPDGDAPASEIQLQTIQSLEKSILGQEIHGEELKNLTKQEASEMISGLSQKK